MHIMIRQFKNDSHIHSDLAAVLNCYSAFLPDSHLILQACVSENRELLPQQAQVSALQHNLL